MTKNDLDQIRQVIREELTSLFRELYGREGGVRYHPRETRETSEWIQAEVSRLAFINDSLSANLANFKSASSLMKGCKYDKSKVDDIKDDTTNIRKKV